MCRNFHLISETGLETYWAPAGLDIHAVQDVVDTLVDRSLLRRDRDNCFNLHDLQISDIPATILAFERYLWRPYECSS